MKSSQSVQQGDPLDPLLFCLAIHKMCAKLNSELAVFYLDGGTLGGSREVVINDVKLIEEEELSNLDLLLNKSKSEHICSDHTRGVVLLALPGLCVVNPEHAELLQSPLEDANTVELV